MPKSNDDEKELLDALDDLFINGSWHDDGSFVYWPPSENPDDEGALGTLSVILLRRRQGL